MLHQDIPSCIIADYLRGLFIFQYGAHDALFGHRELLYRKSSLDLSFQTVLLEDQDIVASFIRHGGRYPIDIHKRILELTGLIPLLSSSGIQVRDAVTAVFKDPLGELRVAAVCRPIDLVGLLHSYRIVGLKVNDQKNNHCHRQCSAHYQKQLPALIPFILSDLLFQFFHGLSKICLPSGLPLRLLPLRLSDDMQIFISFVCHLAPLLIFVICVQYIIFPVMVIAIFVR